MNILKDRNKYPYWHVGLGQWVKSKQHKEQLYKSFNVVEVGTEDIRSKKNRGLSQLDIRARDNPETVKKLYRPGENKKFFTVRSAIK